MDGHLLLVSKERERERERACLGRGERRRGTKKRDDGHPLPLPNLGRGWPPPVSVEQRRGEQRREEEERGWSTPTSLKNEWDGRPLPLGEAREWPPLEGREGDKKREDGDPIASLDRRVDAPFPV